MKMTNSKGFVTAILTATRLKSEDTESVRVSETEIREAKAVIPQPSEAEMALHSSFAV
jgi:hypothetical protein